MKKICTLIVAVLLLAACGGNGTTTSNKTYKTGLAIITSTTDKEIVDNSVAIQANSYIVALTVDQDDVIVALSVDVAQTKWTYTDGVLDASKTVEKTKKQLGNAYGMKETSAKAGIGKEWYEQAEFFEEWAIGKTVDEVLDTPTYEKDASHTTVPEDEELAAGVTIDIGEFLEGIEKAHKNAVETTGVVAKVGLGIVNSTAKTNAEIVEGKVLAQADTVAAVVAVDKDGKIVAIDIDNAQTKVNYANNVLDTAKTVIKTKTELGNAYGMKETSAKAGIGKEWFEQMAAFEEWILGQKVADVLATPTYEKDASHTTVPEDEELAAGVTIDIGDYLEAIETAEGNYITIK